MNSVKPVQRHREILRIRGGLERSSFPRLQMLLLVALTGASGFVASFLLLQAGMLAMWSRYLAAFGVAYLAFLLLLWLWLRTRAEDYANLADLGGSPSSGCPGYGGLGGQFDGGGASASFDTATTGAALSDTGGAAGDALDAVTEGGELALPVLLLVLVGTLLFSSCYMIYSAPTLFAELLLDGVLSASLYRRLRKLERRSWLGTALRRTALPFAVAAAIVAASGWAMAQYAPEAHSIGAVLAHTDRQR